jgi:hypothetical protein
MTRYWIVAPGPRGAFTRYIAFLWEAGHNCDTDGNSESIDDHTWTELTLINRSNQAERVDIDPIDESPLILGVRSDREYLSARMAYAIAVTSGGTLIDPANNKPMEANELLPLMGKFDVVAALVRYNSARSQREA